MASSYQKDNIGIATTFILSLFKTFVKVNAVTPPLAVLLYQQKKNSKLNV